MAKLSVVKQLMLSMGLFRPAYALYRFLNRAESSRFNQEMSFYSKLLEPGKLCFDVGANIGKKTEVFLKSGAAVVAFEPQPDCVKELQARCGNFRDKLNVCPTAVGDQPGEILLHLRDESSGMASVIEDWQGTIKDSIKVPVITLDQAIEKYGKPDYLKIDVEGFELSVFQGLTTPIDLLSFEYHLSEKEIATTQKCLDYLSQFGEIQINLTPAETMVFEFVEWLSLDEFREKFPHEFIDREGYFYGDIFVRTT